MNIKLHNFDIAVLFGLEYIGERGDGGYVQYSYKFSFHGKPFSVMHGCGDDEAVDEDEAKEEAAKRVLYAIGSVVSCALKDEF